MTDDRSLERAARSWLEIGPTEAPERAVEAALLRIDTTPQERDWHVPWRLPKMTTPARVAAAAVIGVLAVGGALFVLSPGRSGVGGPGPIADPADRRRRASIADSAAPRPAPCPRSGRDRGDLRATPFAGHPWRLHGPAQPDAANPADDSIRVTFTVPDGWATASMRPSGSPRGQVTPQRGGRWASAEGCLAAQRSLLTAAGPRAT